MQSINKNSSKLRFFKAAKILFADNNPIHITVDILYKSLGLHR